MSFDRSGSMDGCRQAAIDGFNRVLAEQQQTEGLARLTLVLFDDEYLVPVRSIPVQGSPPAQPRHLTSRATPPCSTPLAAPSKSWGASLALLPENNRPGQVIVAILTDGLENASERFSWATIAAAIKHQSEIDKWTLVPPQKEWRKENDEARNPKQ